VKWYISKFGRPKLRLSFFGFINLNEIDKIFAMLKKSISSLKEWILKTFSWLALNLKKDFLNLCLIVRICQDKWLSKSFSENLSWTSLSSFYFKEFFSTKFLKKQFWIFYWEDFFSKDQEWRFQLLWIRFQYESNENISYLEFIYWSSPPTIKSLIGLITFKASSFGIARDTGIMTSLTSIGISHIVAGNGVISSANNMRSVSADWLHNQHAHLALSAFRGTSLGSKEALHIWGRDLRETSKDDKKKSNGEFDWSHFLKKDRWVMRFIRDRWIIDYNLGMANGVLIMEIKLFLEDEFERLRRFWWTFETRLRKSEDSWGRIKLLFWWAVDYSFLWIFGGGMEFLFQMKFHKAVKLWLNSFVVGTWKSLSSLQLCIVFQSGPLIFWQRNFWKKNTL